MTSRHDQSDRATRRNSEGSWASGLLRAVDVGLVGIVFLAPLFLGGRHPVGALVYISMVCFTATAWAVRQSFATETKYHRSGTELWFAVCIVLVFVQLVPLSMTLIGQLAPGMAKLLPMWTGAPDASASQGVWSTISLFPQATRDSLALFVAHALLFVVVIQRLRSVTDIESMIRMLALATVSMAMIGLAQYVFGNGQFLWVYEHPFRDTSRAAKGPYINENHFAHFLALGVGPLIWWLTRFRATTNESPSQRSRRNNRQSPVFGGPTSDDWWQRFGKLTLTLATGVVVFAGLLSFSRGGLIVMLVGLAVCCAILAWKAQINKTTLVRFSVVGCLVLVAILAYGYKPLTNHISSLQVESLDELDQDGSRRKLWQANLQAFAGFPLLGTGGGSHVEVYKTYFGDYAPVEYTHAESGYIQVLTEYGLVGAGLMVFAIAMCVYWCGRALWISPSTRLSACLAAVVAGLTVSLVHSIWDFVWYLPSCMSVVVILAACARRLADFVAIETSSTGRKCERMLRQPRPVMVSRPLWLTATAVMIATSLILFSQQIKPATASTHWDAFLIAAKAIEKNPEEAHSAESNRLLTEHLAKTLTADPNNARANLKLAANYLRRFEIVQEHSLNPMPLSAIRDAVVSSQFDSPAARDQWLSNAVGENQRLLKLAQYHAARSLRLCPLQGQAYLLLNELAFLENGADQHTKLLDQAVRVRPHDGAILVALGAEAARKGDVQRALVSWKKAFHQDPDQQQQLIKLLAPTMPASFFFTHFDPDLAGLDRLYKHYRAMEQADSVSEVGGPLARLLVAKAKTETGREASRSWRRAHNVLRNIGDERQCLDCIRRAVKAESSDFASRRTLAMELVAQEQYDEAIKQIQWCLYRKPDDATLKAVLRNTHTKRLEQTMVSYRDDEQSPTKR